MEGIFNCLGLGERVGVIKMGSWGFCKVWVEVLCCYIDVLFYFIVFSTSNIVDFSKFV